MCVQEAERGPSEGRGDGPTGGMRGEGQGRRKQAAGKRAISILSPGQRPLEALINILTILVYI